MYKEKTEYEIGVRLVGSEICIRDRSWDLPVPATEFFDILGAAATPGALFAIGASLASKSAERITVAGCLAFCKLILHPGAVAISALLIFSVAPYPAAVLIAATALPVAGNIFILATHYKCINCIVIKKVSIDGIFI